MTTERREKQLGKEIRRLRLKSGSTLRGLAAQLSVSAPHLSDIEHERRRPSETLLRKIALQLRGQGATYESLRELITGIDPETREWVATTPGVRQLLLTVRKSGKPPVKILELLEQSEAGKKTRAKSAKTHPKSGKTHSSRPTRNPRKSVK